LDTVGNDNYLPEFQGRLRRAVGRERLLRVSRLQGIVATTQFYGWCRMKEFILIIFVVLQVLDVLSTYLALKNPSVEERNPLLLWLFSRIGMLQSLILVKAVMISALGIAYYFLPNGRLGISIGLGLTSVLYIYVVISNLRNGT
jgi:hypothetical protein